MFSRAIVDRLVADPEKPWAEYRHGKPLTQKQLANLLNGFGVFSDTVHQGEVQAKGYKREQLLPLFDRYLHVEGEKPTFEPYNRTSDCGTGISDENRTVREDNPYGSKNANLSYSHAGSYGCTVRKAGNGGGATEAPVCAQCGAHDGTEHPHTIDGREVWLHPECKHFWLVTKGREQRW